MNPIDRENLDRIKAKWEELKDGGDRLGKNYALAVALWASMNVDYLIALAEKDRQP